MFWFENGHCLLNAAYRFEFASASFSQSFTYDVQAAGNRKFLCVDPLLRKKIRSVRALDERRLALGFEAGDLIIHDAPDMRSAWFYRFDPSDHDAGLLWSVDDDEGAETL